MALQWPLPTYVDGDFTVATAIGLPIFTSPLPNTTAQLVFRQEFMQYLANVTPLALNTPHPSSGMTPDYSNTGAIPYYLIAEGDKQDCGGGVVKWFRTYSAIPASYSDWSEMVYNFIGTGPIGPMTSGNVGRLRFSDKVKCRIQNDFFMVGVGFTDPITGTVVASGAFTSPGVIPEIWAITYCQQVVISGTQYGGLFYRQDYVCDSVTLDSNVGWLVQTTPTATQYAAMVLDAAKNSWAAAKSFQVIDTSGAVALVSITSPTVSSPTVYGGQIIAENSTIDRWQRSGNIWVRRTKYVLAQ